MIRRLKENTAVQRAVINAVKPYSFKTNGNFEIDFKNIIMLISDVFLCFIFEP